MRHEQFQTELFRYPFQIELATRYGDCDVMGHINNVAFARLFEESRIQFNMAIHGASDLRHFGQRDRIMLVATHLFYLRELHYPSTVTVGVGIIRIGTSSYTLSAAMFRDDGQCVAINQSTLASGENGKSMPLSQALKDAAARMVMDVAAPVS